MIATVPAGGDEGRGPAPSRRPRGPSTRAGARSPRRSAAASCSGWPRGSGPAARSWPSWRRCNSGQADRRVRVRHGRRRHLLRVLRRARHQDPRRGPARPRQRGLHGHAGADGRGRPDHPLELPAADGGLEDRARARRGLHRGPQARGADAAHASSSWPRTSRSVGLPQGVVNVVTGYGPGAGAPLVAHPEVRQDRLHRQRRGGQAHHAERRRPAEAGVASSWAASRPTSSSPTPTSRPRWTAPSSASSSTRARSARRAAACWCSRPSTRSSWTPLAEKAKTIKLGPGMDRETKMGPLVSEEQRDRVASYLKIGRGRRRWRWAAARPKQFDKG